MWGVDRAEVRSQRGAAPYREAFPTPFSISWRMYLLPREPSPFCTSGMFMVQTGLGRSTSAELKNDSIRCHPIVQVTWLRRVAPGCEALHSGTCSSQVPGVESRRERLICGIG